MTAPKPVHRTCPECGTQFRTVPSQDKRYCSVSCAATHRHRTNPLLKPNTKPTATSWKPGDNMGTLHPRWKEPLKFTCKQCQTTFYLKPWRANRPTQKNLFCSATCRSEHRKVALSGPNAPDWVGGPRTYRGRGWTIARQQVVTDQQGCCANCGVHVGPSLPVHHKRPFREFASVEAANQRENLIGLCQSCHMRLESRPIFPRTAAASPVQP